MRKYYSIPLIFLFLAASIGLFLRWQFVTPTPGVRYTFFLHSHSHVMFLGWVFNVLFLAFTGYHLPAKDHKRFRKLFVLLQLLVAAMMISFPIQGYGLYSIIFSTLHTIISLGFIVVFFRKTRGDRRVSTWFARTAWFFFFLSTAGPFSLGYLMSNDLGQSVWYNVSIYYYLHFQYNGFFLFGLFGLFFQMLESKKIEFSSSAALRFGRWTALACVPAYLLSVLYAKPPIVFHVIGGIAALIQIVVLTEFLLSLRKITQDLRQHFNPFALKLLHLVAVSLALKCALQLASAYPYLAELAYSMRPVVIAYLHLVLVGVVSVFLLAWYFDHHFLQGRAPRNGIVLLLIGFVGSETCLVMMPWWSTLIGAETSPADWIFALSVIMWAGILICLLSFRSTVSPWTVDHRPWTRSDKSQSYR